MVPKTLIRTLLFLVTPLFFAPSAFANSMVLFDFDDIHSPKKKVKAADIEAYMEGLFGADLSVSPNTTAIRGGNSLNFLHGPAAGLNSGYLKIGKGKGAGIIIDFGDNPIDSFSVDFQIFKRAKSFTILADGVVINQEILSKSERKTGLAGHQTYFFDTPVETLQFVGVRKKSFAIDNLAINLPLDEHGAIFTGGVWQTDINLPFVENSPGNQLNSVPEPSSLLMLVVGLCGALLSRRVLAWQR
jgi:PEP-CTERM motif